MKVKKKAAKTRPVFALKCDPRIPVIQPMVGMVYNGMLGMVYNTAHGRYVIQPMVWYGMVKKLP